MIEEKMDRRDFMRQGSLLSAALAAMGLPQPVRGATPIGPTLPTIKLGQLEVSRLILGSNPFYGFSHQSKELSREMVAYYTDARIAALLDAAANHGITAVASPPYERWIRLFSNYLERGGKLRTWIAQPDGKPSRMKDEIAAAVEGGAKVVFVQGARVDAQFAAGNLDVVGDWIEHIKGLGVPAGMASHGPDVHLEAEKRGFPTDFYFQCFYNPRQGYREEDRQKAIAAIRQIAKPVVGYKILAAGRTGAAEGFEFAFRHLRDKDGVCVGMFPKRDPDQIEENVGLTIRGAARGGPQSE